MNIIDRALSNKELGGGLYSTKYARNVGAKKLEQVILVIIIARTH